MERIPQSRHHVLFLLGLLLLAACGNLSEPSEEQANLTDGLESDSPIEPTEATVLGVDIGIALTPSLTNVRIQDDNEYSFSFLIPFDGIMPVYEPEFVAAQEAPLIDEELVIGVAWGGEAKAYPITVLRFREMVNDDLAGIPTLVTW